MRSCGESVDAKLVLTSCHPRAPVGSARVTSESARKALDRTCGAPIIPVKGNAVALTAIKWEIPVKHCEALSPKQFSSFPLLLAAYAFA